jgi:phosphomannomutase / phosphoglucomutase
MLHKKLITSIFKAYDIRGVVETALTPDAVRQIGQAIGLYAKTKGAKQCVVGRDGRLTGPVLIGALTEGLRDAGMDVIDIGMVATPMVYWATYHLGTGTGVVVTGSHNPPEYNGIKMMVAGEAIYGETIQDLRRAIEAGLPAPANPRGGYSTANINAQYQQRIVSDIKLAVPLKVAVDCGNGAPGAYAPALMRALGCEVTELFCEVDGNFPNHHPDPAHEENLQDIIKCLQTTDCEIGLAFDGDGDRLGVVTKDGQIIWPDRQMMLYARNVLSRNPGAQIIYDVKCTRLLGEDIRKAGGQPLMWKTGHSLMKAKLKETGAPLAGEMSGHIFFKERWYGFDDGLYTAARMLEILSKAKTAGQDITAVLNGLPNSSSTPELQLKCAEGENVTLVEKLKANGGFDGAANLVTIDGIRVEYADGFGLARPSNTTPVVVIRFEADNATALARIQAQFRAAIMKAKPDAVLPF